MQALLVSPQRVGKVSQGGHKDGGKDIYERPAYELQKTPCNKSEQGVSVDGAYNECVVRFAYNMAARDDMNEAE